MLTIEIIGAVLVLLFLAAAMTGIEGAEGRRRALTPRGAFATSQ